MGSTGSIGKSTLAVIGKYPDRFKVVALAAGGNIDLLERQVRAFRPRIAAVVSEKAAAELRPRLSGMDVDVLSGVEGMISAAAAEEADITVSAIVGTAGLVPTMAAIKAGKDVALANKEALVTAGEVVTAACREAGVALFPVDSEHSAIFQCLNAGAVKDIRRLILTASGGPFRNASKEDLERVTPAEALKHPNWNMGRKITIDSATLMNKGLEVIEARWLFGIGPERINVLIHPQSIVHSMVEYQDGSVVAQLGMPDMRGPIAYALSYPERLEGASPSLNLAKIGTLTFQEPDLSRFPCLSYAYEALKTGGTMPAVVSAANEAAVKHFLEGDIGFMDIPRVIRMTMDAHQPGEVITVDDALRVDIWARAKAEDIIRGAFNCGGMSGKS